MPSVESFSSPLNSPLAVPSSKEEALEYYKKQYEQLESELADFQTSSRELEAELEKDVEAAEKRERQLREKVQELNYEVDEWKAKCKQSKAEANTAQNALQKEITTLRDTNRTIQLKLRDIEVANDDFERQARNTTSSLEDLESKYNVAIERGVMLEEEIKVGEQERERLRIEAQRLRDELSDLKVEAEISQEKLRHAEAMQSRHTRKPSPLAAEIPRPESALSDASPETTASSPTIATPPAKSVSSAASDTPTPPSPPVSDRSLPSIATPASSLPKTRLSINSAHVTPRPGQYSRASRHSRGPSTMTGAFATPATGRRNAYNRPESRQTPYSAMPSSTSLTQIRGLIGKMQKLEARVHSARSKLPGPTSTPRTSPRPGSALSHTPIAANVTVRSQRKRTGGSNAASTAGNTNEEATEPSRPPSRISRLSYSHAPPTPTTESARPAPPMSSRPSSRASVSSRLSMSGIPIAPPPLSRPASRQSLSGSNTVSRGAPGHYAASTATSESRAKPRPRSSLGGSYAASHGHSASVSRISSSGFNTDEEADALTPTPSRRTTLGKDASGSAIPAPSTAGRRQSGAGLAGIGAVGGKRASSGGPGMGIGDMGPPKARKGPGVGRMVDLGEMGETY